MVSIRSILHKSQELYSKPNGNELYRCTQFSFKSQCVWYITDAVWSLVSIGIMNQSHPKMFFCDRHSIKYFLSLGRCHHYKSICKAGALQKNKGKRKYNTTLSSENLSVEGRINLTEEDAFPFLLGAGK